VDVPTSTTRDVVWNQDCYLEVDWKGLKTIEMFEVIEYDTHWKVILWRSRVGNGLRPKVCIHALHYCKRVVLRFPGVVPAE